MIDGKGMRELRKANSLTQADLASFLGVSRAFVNRMECGAAPVAKRTAQCLLGLWYPSQVAERADEYEYSLAELLKAGDEVPSAFVDSARALREMANNAAVSAAPFWPEGNPNKPRPKEFTLDVIAL